MGEKEKRKKKKKRKSILTNEDLIDFEILRENDQDQSIRKPSSMEVIHNEKLIKEEDTNKLDMHADDLDINDHKTIDRVKVDNISDVMHDETISSNETLATKINLDSDIKIIHTELTSETKTIETECADDVPIIESKIASDNTSLNEFNTSSPENETKVKRKSIK